MFKLSNQFQIISIYLFIFLGLLFFYNNKIKAMNNNDDPGTSNNIYDYSEEYQNLLLEQTTKAQEVINALEHQVSENKKNFYLNNLKQYINKFC
ncbi:SVM family protein [Candidatus Phytoplasma australasiaticum]